MNECHLNSLLSLYYFNLLLVVITPCLSGELFMPIPCPQSHPIPSLGCKLFEDRNHASIVTYPRMPPQSFAQRTSSENIGSLIQHVIREYLLCASYGAKTWGYSDEHHRYDPAQLRCVELNPLCITCQDFA